MQLAWHAIQCVLVSACVYAFPARPGMLVEVEEQLDNGYSEQQKQAIHARWIRKYRHHKHKVEQLRKAVQYLLRFGYIEKGVRLTPDNVEEALAAFQHLVGVKQTRQIDHATMDMMQKPRCGNADIPIRISSKGLKQRFRRFAQRTRRSSKRRSPRREKRFARINQWTNKLDNNDVLRLTWHIQKYTNDIDHQLIKRTVKRAFDLWSTQIKLPALRTIKLEFSEADTADSADINILWATGEHGDAYPFDDDGNRTATDGNILAHTFYPPNHQEPGTLSGDIHFDDYELWVVDSERGRQRGVVYFPYVLVHEIGHALGLGHSNSQQAVMYPIYKNKPIEQVILDIDDRCAISWNYVGVTQTCMLVYTLVELLPRGANRTTVTDNDEHLRGLTAALLNEPDDAHRQLLDRTSELQRRVNSTLELLQNGSIPKCGKNNNVQQRYEVLLENNLRFPRDVAQQQGPVVCNFLDGLATTVERKTKRSVRRTDSIALLTAHAYPHRFSSSRQPSGDDFDAMSRNLRRKRDASSTLDDRELFDEKFFDDFLLLFAEGHQLQ